ncbi:hypothetical protein CBR_g37467 [Chara braunii]|uniref:Protein kinase domain-containing protein n=1 Tax=Chara braunii TaxID=69332 RepID=A0A388LN52_CHABU|nr:hypothetical protein CBR_g37467 [Chara braunii]|eukprot:GBG83665.1 hypothetical protein CBR_g37467 [Chara braunii]
MKASFFEPSKPVVTGDGCNLFVMDGGRVLCWITLDSPCSSGLTVTSIARFNGIFAGAIDLHDNGSTLSLYVGMYSGEILRMELNRSALHVCKQSLDYGQSNATVSQSAPPSSAPSSSPFESLATSPSSSSAKLSPTASDPARPSSAPSSVPSVSMTPLPTSSAATSEKQAPDSTRRDTSSKSNSAVIAIVVPITTSVAILPAVGALVLFRRSRRRRQDVPAPSSSAAKHSLLSGTTIRDASPHRGALQPASLQEFSLEPLAHCTNNFDQRYRVGEKGAFGEVFWGSIADRQVAIKVMIGELTPEKRQQFVAESHARLHNRGGIPGKNPLPPLTLGERVSIAYQMGSGLSYLHHGANPPVIHRDIKSRNVLLTDGSGENLHAVLADFGLAAIGQNIFKTTRKSFVETSHIAGTHGYIAPEYFLSGRLTVKNDVYAFGVIALELLSGRRAATPQDPSSGGGWLTIVGWANDLAQRADCDLPWAILDDNMRGEVESSSKSKYQAQELTFIEADRVTNTLVLKMKCGQTYRVPLIGTTTTPRPDPPPPEPSVPTPSPSITVTSPRQFAHFIRQDDVTFFMVDVTNLLHYDPPCPDAELIPLCPDPPSISMAPISTSVPPPSVESTPPSRADADVEELARYMVDLEPVVRDLIREYHDVFPSSFSYAGIPPMRDVEHSIQLVPDYCVHHHAPYRLSIPEDTELKRQLEEFLRLGFIKPSNSPWGAPVLFARKADGTLRLCIDYRDLNRYTVKNIYPMPCSDELFDRLAGNRFFTKIDLRIGYHQIRVAATDQPKTAFRSRFGHYEFTVMPFGLTNAPAIFQRAMNDIFRDILEQYVLVYLDDILVYSRPLEEHLRHLRDVLDRLRRHDFYAKLSKCRFAQHKVDFLGHYVSDQSLHMDDAKITAIAEWPAPTSAKQLRSFLGLTSYYSNFILGYARYSYVLTSSLLRKNPPWAWTPLHEDAFRALKNAVTCALVLHLPDFDRPFILTTDASDFVVGAVLSQAFPSSPDSSHPRIPRFPPPTPTTGSRLTPTRPATDEPSIDYSPTITEDGTVESR